MFLRLPVRQPAGLVCLTQGSDYSVSFIKRVYLEDHVQLNILIKQNKCLAVGLAKNVVRDGHPYST